MVGLENDPRSVRGLTIDELEVVFQPIVDLSTHQSWALEGLARCSRPHFRNPEVLFQAAVEQRGTGRLGRMLREVAIERAKGNRIFVNIHPHELSSRWLVRPDDPIAYHDAEVYLEITETAALEYFDLCRSVLQEVCARTGAHLVLDDFGAGYSNLQRFLQLQPAVVKVDRSLVSQIDRDRRRQRMLRHLTSLFVDLGSRVVAEGIETVSELLAVIDAGVQYGQGYLLARPAYPIPMVNWPA